MNKLTGSQREELIKLMGEMIEPHIPALSDAFQRFGNWLEDISKKHSSLISQLVLADWAEVSKRLEEMPQRSKKAMNTAFVQGWFFNWQGSLQTVLGLIDSIEAAGDDQNQIDTILKEHFIEYIDYYSGQLSDAYPERKSAIDSAVSAHKTLGDSGYFLSIPVFLAQADGIFSEVCEISMAMGKSQKKPEVKGVEFIRSRIGEDGEASDLLSPLFNLHESDLLKSEGARNSEFDRTGVVFNALNRHQVLHGEVSNYGTELNSLKAFSLLAFVGLHLPTILATVNPRSK